MSEFQYFGFVALERPLTNDEQGHLRSYSTRAKIGPRSFTNEYHWGDFKGDAIKWMEQYFDGHVYLSNFGSRALHLRLPVSLLDLEQIRPYEMGRVFEVRRTKKHLILSFYSNEDSGRDDDEHDEDPGRVLDNLLPLRDELARGDLRALYLVWLLAARNGMMDDDELEPPVPSGLALPSQALKHLISFLWLDPELVEVAALRSASPRPQKKSTVTPETWLTTLSLHQKDAWLLRFLNDGEDHTALELQRDFRLAVYEDLRTPNGAEEVPETSRRSVVELLDAADNLAERRQEEAKQKIAEQRANYLRGLAGQETLMWKSIIALTATSTASNHESAVRLIIDLRDLADLTGGQAFFTLQFSDLLALRKRKSAFLALLDKAGVKWK